MTKSTTVVKGSYYRTEILPKRVKMAELLTLSTMLNYNHIYQAITA
jgi:hypothetical protein